MPVAISNLTATWANSEITYTGIGMNVNGDSYNANSALIDLKINSNSILKVTANGILYINSAPIGGGSNTVAIAAFNTANAAFDTANAAGGGSGVAIAAAFAKANAALANTSGNTFDGNLITGGDLTVNGQLYGNNTVGIGTKTPNTTIEIADRRNLSLRFSSNLDPTFYREIGRDNFSTGNFIIRRAQGGASVDDLVIDTVGRVGLGTEADSLSHKLTVKEGANIVSYLLVDGMNVAPTIASAYNKANSANVLAYNTGIGANSWSNGVGASANSFLLTTLSGANLVSSAAFDKANLANVIAVSSFDKTNLSNIIASTSYDKANAANVIAVAAFGAANSANPTVGPAAFDKANSANIVASSSYDKANAANIIASAAFDTANAAGGGSGVAIAAAFAKANAALSNTSGVTFDGNLIVSGGSVGLDNNSQMYFNGVSGGASDYGAMSYDNSNSLLFRTNASERLRIDSSGNVGIGTTTPASNLHVVGTANISSNLIVQGIDVINSIIEANTAVKSITGTVNQISVSGTTSITLSTPQNISNTSNLRFFSLGVGTDPSNTSGEIRATNNITAYYSDERLKLIIGKINSALEKVNSLSGVYFVNNDVAKSYGYTDEKLQVGVIAQEIQKVLPEIVVPAPFDIAKDENGNEYSKSGKNYLTVHYEKIIPLLIEAIKELSDIVNKKT